MTACSPEKVAPTGLKYLDKQSNTSEEVFTESVSLHWRIIAFLLYYIYTWFPLNSSSRLFGFIARITLPVFLRCPLCRLFAWIFKANIEEAEFYTDLKQYQSLSHFFRRRLHSAARSIDTNACLISPVDGKIIFCGKVKDGQLEQVKGLVYTLRAFLGPNTWSKTDYCNSPSCNSIPQRESTNTCDGINFQLEDSILQYPKLRTSDQLLTACSQGEIETFSSIRNASLYHCAVYLAPGDYHCFHSATDWTISLRRHFPGRLFSVSSLVTSWLRGLFCVNERAVYVGEWKYGFFAYVAVGATNVGSIQVYEDPTLVTNRLSYMSYSKFRQSAFKKDTTGVECKTGENHVPTVLQMGGYEDLRFSNKLHCKQGDIFGNFNLGSTVVLIFEAPTNNFEFVVKTGDRVLVGNPLGHVS